MNALFLALLVLVSALCVAPLTAAQEPVEPANPPISEPIAVEEPPVEAPVASPVADTLPAPVAPPQALIEPPTNATQPPTNGTAPVAQGGLSPEIQRILSYTTTALLCLVGLVFVFAGYRIFKIGLFILGFISFFAIVWIVLYQHAQVWYNGSLWWLCYVIPALAGLAGGFMFLCILKIGVFFVGFILGVAVAAIVLSTPLGTKVLTIYWTHVVIVAGAGVVLGVLALFLEKAILVIGTAASGSYMIAVGIDMSFSQTRVLSAVLENIFSGQNINLNWDDIKSNVLPYALIAGMIVFCIAGIIVQFCYTGRNYDHRSGKNKRRDPYGYDESTAPLLPQ